MSVFNPTTQQKAATNYPGNMVITACPGSGKTTVIQNKITAITSELPSHKGVVAITFTNKASIELKKRCVSGAHDIKQSFFGTIDSFCYKELILPFLPRVWEGKVVDREVIKGLSPFHKSFFLDDYKSPDLESIERDKGFKSLYDEGYLWMASFSGLALYILNESYAARRYIKARYSHVFIDEYQDSSLAQHQLFLKLFELGLVATAVGDKAQSIYEFRGGDSGLLEELVKDAKLFKHFEIDVNHRCHTSINNYATKLLHPEAEIVNCDEIRIFRRNLNGNLTDIGAAISEWISSWLEQGAWGVEAASDFALLVRKDKSLKLLASGLTVKHRAYTNTPLDDMGTQCADLYKELLSFKYGAIETAQELIEKVLSPTVVSDIGLKKIRGSILQLREGKTSEEVIDSFREVAYLAGEERTLDEDKAVEVIVNEDSKYQFMPLDKNEVQVMTLHKSKGLEFKVVFHFDLEEWSFPFQKVVDNDWENPTYPSYGQEINLHYVGITRAENCCILVRSQYRQNRNGSFKNSSPSLFLKLPQLEGLYK
ncbi:UvrD-helicase domain-containing protein [Chromohalobacter nigrandesensis]|uniref:UvrD-helicase domain-containing protein n=1 Tax=Chromohalobacter nigrandesensis TaxID=119863 RepID=UPI001FF15CDA|nr:ATP-dependent helicase [Chromohalobacter nigrandesensis]MCK0746281.1 ATP-dependent helicase [Chromohalobacter nigrandesensis]